MPEKKNKKVTKTTKTKIQSTAKQVQNNKQQVKKFAGKYVEAKGGRKRSIARVRIYPESEKKDVILVNNKHYLEYFKNDLQNKQTIEQPLKIAGKLKEVAISAKVKGGGLKAQAESIRLGIAKVLVKLDKELRPALKAHKLLTRDARKKERKKPGLKRARRAPQWQKR